MCALFLLLVLGRGHPTDAVQVGRIQFFFSKGGGFVLIIQAGTGAVRFYSTRGRSRPPLPSTEALAWGRRARCSRRVYSSLAASAMVRA